MIEGDIKGEAGSDSGAYRHCDLLLYKISPAHSFPGTYPVLDSDGSDREDEEQEQEGSAPDQSPLGVMQSVKAGLRQQPNPSTGKKDSATGVAAFAGMPGVEESTGDLDLDSEVERVFAEQLRDEREEASRASAAGDGNDDERMLEAHRQYTRAAVDCLHCYPGGGEYDRGDETEEGGAALAQAQAAGHAASGSEEELDTNRRHAAGSIAAIVTEEGPMPGGSASQLEAAEQDAVDAVLIKTQRLMQVQGGKLSKEQNTALYAELLDAQAAESAPTTGGRGARDIRGALAGAEDAEVVLDEEAADGAHLDPTILLTALYPPEVELPMHAVLEHLCPPLRRAAVPMDDSTRELYGLKGADVSSTLQHKAMRVTYSVGVDILVMDSYTSAALGKVDNLTVQDLLTPSETSRVFGQFGVPKTE